MKAIGSCFTVGFRLTTHAAARRPFATDVKPSKTNSLDGIKPHLRSGILSAIKKDDSGFPSHLILKETSPFLSQVMMEVKNKKRRKQRSSILLEGKRLIQDALNAGVKPKQIFFSQKRVLENLCLPGELRDLSVSNTIFYKTPYKMIELFSEITTSQGIMGIFEMPVINHEVKSCTFPITVVCDNIRDPGNLGAVLRIVTAVGGSQIILIKGCTDLWGDKVLRSACGAHFRMRIVPEVSWSSLVNIKGQVCLADNNFVASNGDCSNIVDHDKVNVFRKTTSSELRIVPYDEVDYCKTTPLIIVIGGETQGLSDDAYEFARTRKGVRVNIPLQNGIESLNTATAAGILCFEVRKQMLHLRKNGNGFDNVELVN